MSMTSNQARKKDMNRNPTGKGGFGDNPQNRSDGRWSKEDSISYQYSKLIRLSVRDFENWSTEHTDDNRTVAQEIAYNAVLEARKDLSYLKEVTDRTEGKAVQKIDAKVDNVMTERKEDILNELRASQGTQVENGTGEN